MKLDTRRIPLFAGVAALVLIVAWYFLLLSPEMKKVKSAHKAHAAAEQQIGQLQSQVSQLQAWVKQIPQDNARFAQLEAALPDNPQLDQALILIHQAAASSGVAVTSLAPTAPGKSAGGQASQSAGPGAPSIAVSVTAQGGGAQIKAFLGALQGLPRTVVIDNVALGGGSTVTANISARIFYAGQPTP